MKVELTFRELELLKEAVLCETKLALNSNHGRYEALNELSQKITRMLLEWKD